MQNSFGYFTRQLRLGIATACKESALFHATKSTEKQEVFSLNNNLKLGVCFRLSRLYIPLPYECTTRFVLNKISEKIPFMKQR